MEPCNIVLSVAAMDGAFETLKKRLSAVATVRVVGLDGYSLRDADVFIGKKMDGACLKEANRLKAVFAYKTGVDDFPVGEFDKRGILLVNSHVNSRYIAEYAFGLGVALVNRIAEFDRRMRLGDWATENPCWESIFTMKVGLFGYGGIGREIHKLLLQNKIPAYTLDRGKTYENISVVRTPEELCEVSDLVMLSLPKTPETDGMFDRKLFSHLKGKYLVNVGRGNCIDEEALYSALTDGTLAGAAIDTWRQKPAAGETLLPFDHPFHKLPNVILSSHKAMQLKDGHERYVLDTLDSVLSYLRGELPKNAVDLKAGY